VALATLLGLEIRDRDVDDAFLNTPLETPEYGVMPEPFHDQRGGRVYCELHSAFYGSKKAMELFGAYFASIVLSGGFKRIAADSCAFFKTRGKDFFLCVVYVDNCFSIATDPALHKEFEDTLRKHLRTTAVDDAQNILGMTVTRTTGGGRMLRTPKMIDDAMRACFGETSFKGALTPMSTSFNDSDADASPKLSAEGQTWMRGVLGTLGFVIHARPCIMFAHNKLSTRMHAPTDCDAEAARRIVRFLAFTQTLGVTFHRGSDDLETQMLTELTPHTRCTRTEGATRESAHR